LPHRVYVEEGSLVVELRDPELLELLKRKVKVPLADVTSVEAGLTWDDIRSQVLLRLLGFYVPGKVIEGVFMLRDRTRALFAVRDPSKALLIRLRGGPYARIYVEVPDPHAALTELRANIAKVGDR
jgi:hypothetical protein